MKFIKKTDVIVVASIIVVALLALFLYSTFFGDKPAKAQIFYNQELLEEVDLTEGVERDFSIKGHENVLLHLHSDGSISFKESDCPDKVCIRSGKLSITGQSAACLPNGIVIRIVSNDDDKNSQLDIVV